MAWHDNVDFEVLKGKVLTKIEGDRYSDSMNFYTDDGEVYNMYHSQSCCESVSIEDICGDLDDLIGSPILDASCEEGGDDPDGFKASEYCDSYTWTFYKLHTAKGHVTIRWYGESNGYYSESVDFVKVK